MSLRLALGLLLALAGCHRCSPSAAPPARTVSTIEIPRSPARVVIDGKAEDEIWPVAWRSPALEDTRGRRQPHAEIRLAGDDEHLYALVYVADEELRTSPRPEDPRGVGDLVELEVGPLRLPLVPGRPPAIEGVRVAMDVDGSVDAPDDSDEEWVTEIAIPWRLIGANARAEGVDLRIVRVDAPKGERERAMAWPRESKAHVQLSR